MLTLNFVSDSISVHLNELDEAQKESITSHNMQKYVKQVCALGTHSAMWNLLMPTTFAITLTTVIGYIFGILVLVGFVAGFPNCLLY